VIRLGLTQRVDVAPGHGERRDALDQAWAPLLLENGFLPLPLPNCASDAKLLVAELSLDGVILTGGNDLAHLPDANRPAPERDRFESRLLEVCAERGLPVLGVCRGLQKLVAEGGGTLVRVEGHVAAPHALRASPRSDIPLSDREAVNSFHHMGVHPDGLPPELEAVAFAPDGSVEAAVHRTLPWWGIMWHPERGPRDPRDLDLLRARFAGRRG
jgi:putative glutamine amidotransferase